MPVPRPPKKEISATVLAEKEISESNNTINQSQLIKQGYEAIILENLPNNRIKIKIFQTNQIVEGTSISLRQTYVIYPSESNQITSLSTQSEEINQDTIPNKFGESFDKRLVFAQEGDKILTSFNSTVEAPLTDGMAFKDTYTKDGKSATKFVPWSQYTKSDSLNEFFGVPSLMNENAYINLFAAGGKNNNKYLFDGEKRWYNVKERSIENGQGVQPSSTPTVSEIVEWSKQPENINKFPYRFQDFAYCKYWNKIPNNYLITLRRYPYPVNDAVDLGVIDNEVEPTSLRPAATLLSWLGESTGNTMNSILGPLETSLKWGEAKAQVWEVTTDVTPATVNNPAPKYAFIAQALTGGLASTRQKQPPPTPQDPYNNGPYANKIYGPVNVIDSVKKRERGMEFKHSLNLVFEWVARPYGGINTKAAALDIIGNILVCCSATAPFWGGINRFMPSAAQGQTDPFLGGPAGRQAWINANPGQFLSAVMSQFNTIYDNIKGIFDQLMGNPIEGLKKLANDGAKDFMKYATTDGRTIVQGIRSLLTGEPVGEWHVTIGAPHNPIMMIGNLICTNCKIELGDEMGPDDFPIEIKATITLEHGMPRDRVGIESMFNKGRGRFYSLPKGYEESFSSLSETRVDKVTGKTIISRLKTIDKAVVGSKRTALYSLGFDSPENIEAENKKAREANERDRENNSTPQK